AKQELFKIPLWGRAAAAFGLVPVEREAGVLLLNGDTLFEPAIADRLIAAPMTDIVVTVDRKPTYDADDMKVETRGDDLFAIGKTIQTYDAESIGFLRFSDRGAARFRSAMEAALRDPDNLRRWYLSIIHELARQGGGVSVCSIEGLGWGEMDFLADVATNEALVQGWLAR
ncbi:MAG: nucleotidyltransferase, partial [Brevundimonas mediterranea]